MKAEAIEQTLSTLPLNGNHPLLYISLVIGLSLIPFVLLSVTSFIKLSVVFGILRNAIGAQQVPSSAITSLIALVLTIQIMAPVCAEIKAAVEQEMSQLGLSDRIKKGNSTGQKESSITLEQLFRFGKVSAKPLQEFLERNTRPRERIFFANVGEQNRGKVAQAAGNVSATNEFTCTVEENENQAAIKICRPEGETLFTLVSAFMISELHQAFAIGFAIFLPFLVIDLVTANLLVGLGMMMVSPISVSLPFKIILFVLCDGWFLLSKGLMLSYL